MTNNNHHQPKKFYENTYLLPTEQTDRLVEILQKLGFNIVNIGGQSVDLSVELFERENELSRVAYIGRDNQGETEFGFVGHSERESTKYHDKMRTDNDLGKLISDYGAKLPT